MGYLEENRGKNQSTPGGELCQVFIIPEDETVSDSVIEKNSSRRMLFS